MPFSREELTAALDVVRRHVPPTPVYDWPLLRAHCGGPVVVKHENHTPTGAFKVRGGLVYADRLRRERPEVTGLVSATRGNHGQSLAFAGRVNGLSVTIVVPHGNSLRKNAAMRGFGAEVVEHGHDFQAAVEHAHRLADERGLELVPAYHPDLVLGVATYAWELFEDEPELATVHVPVGMGSGISGLMAVRDLLGLDTQIVGVVTERAPATALSFRAGTVVPTTTADTFVDGVACRVPDATAVAAIVAGAARIVTVSEDDAATAVRTMLETTSSSCEPAGALGLAGLLADRERDPAARAGVVLSGGNIDAAMLAELIAGRTPAVGGSAAHDSLSPTGPQVAGTSRG